MGGEWYLEMRVGSGYITDSEDLITDTNGSYWANQIGLLLFLDKVYKAEIGILLLKVIGD